MIPRVHVNNSAYMTDCTKSKRNILGPQLRPEEDALSWIDRVMLYEVARVCNIDL